MMDVSRETSDRLRALCALVVQENARQNLIARSTVDDVWDRHIVDSLQLLPHAVEGRWLDIGSGAGFPGLVVAAAEPDREVVLVEPRARRAAFLTETARRLDLDRVVVHAAKVEAVAPVGAAVVSARAVASLDLLFAIGLDHATPECRWLLPKGRRAAEELANARRTWQGHFTLIPSITDPEASIVMAQDVTRRHGR